MYLSKLELHGFKSFASRTVLDFDPGITSIVGPNGCGKSNIVDAVRWVIGEQRARVLRSEKMDNVIFNGTAKRRPLGMAEVLLTVENNRGVLPTEYSEVTLGRRLYRSGESEYLLNGVPCRLKDIVNLFMDTGMGAGAYSVIELKMIEEILSDNAQDRRHLFEEAAGITKYKQRRTQTLRKLDSTQADLTRLRDLTEEIEKRVRSLKRQANKATRYQEQEARRHHLELALAQIEYNHLRDQQQLLENERQHLEDELEEHTARMAKDEAQLEALRKTLVDREQALSQHQQQLNAHLTAVRDLEAEARLEQERLDSAYREQERTGKEQQAAQEQRTHLEQHLADLEDTLADATPLHEEANRVLQDAIAARDAAREHAKAAQENLNRLRQTEQHTQQQRTEHLRTLDRLQNRIDLLAQEQQKVETQIAASETGAQDFATQKERLQAEVDEQQQRVEKAAQELERVAAEEVSIQQALATALSQLQETERKHDALTAEIQLLESLVSSFEEFPDTVQFLAQDATWHETPWHTVADVLTCAPAHQAALHAALGELAACLIVATEADAARAIQLLNDKQKGRATFLVLDRLPQAPTKPATTKAGAQPMQQLVEVSNPAYESLATLLLRDCYYVSSLNEGREQARTNGYPARFFAPTGEWVDARGFERAGSEQSNASPVAGRMERREQLDKAKVQLEEVKTLLDQQRETANDLRETLAALPLDAYRQQLTEVKQTYAEAERAHTRLQIEEESMLRRRAEMAERLTNLEREHQEAEAATGPLETAVAEAEHQLAALQKERETAEATFLTAESESRAAQDRFSEANVAAVEARNRYDNLQRDIARTQQDLETLARRAEERRAHLDTLQTTIDTAQERLDALTENLDEVRSQRDGLEEGVSQAKSALLQIKVDIDQVEFRLRKLRQARESAIHEVNTRAVRLAENETRTEDLLASIEEAYSCNLAETPVEIKADFDVKAARAEVQELRQALKNLGSINALALEEYEEEKERFEFMTAQKEDLEQAEETLLETIHEINTTAAARFNETFEAIRMSFCGLFAELFGQDATADLALEEEDDPLESPISIMAKPRGKRPVSIAQLSSGEKTLTAIALLFAIYLVKPSPFCILDEVDAPLDDANIDRFMRLIRRFSENTQFILVTHNKRTMELADRLYGITMQEQGISRLVGVKFDEALEMAG